jgi:hypothetical protein
MLTCVFAAVFSLYASPADGTISIVTIPDRVEIWIDNNYVGLSPVRQKRLAAGTYTVRLIDPSQQISAVEMVTVRRGEHVSVERTLDSRLGKLRVNSDPPGADVVIITELGKTPLVNDFMNPGLYKIEIRHPNQNYLPVVEDVTFTDDRPVVIDRVLEKPPVLTRERKIQLALGTGAAAGFVWAIVEQNTASAYRQKSIYADEENAEEY